MSAPDTRLAGGTAAGDPEPLTRNGQAWVDLAQSAAEPALLEPGDYAALVVPPGGSVVTVDRDTDDHRRRSGKGPGRSVGGTTTVRDEQSMIELVKRWPDWSDQSITYADPVNRSVVTVLNDDWDANGNDSGGNLHGWRDRRVQLALTHTPEWQRWAALDRKMLPQQTFAEHIEDSLEDIRSPSAADMLETAQTLVATVGVNFRSQTRLRDGNRQFTYEESTEGQAGRAGDMAIPDEFELGLVPWQGRDARPFIVKARLRFRIQPTGLLIGYVLVDVERILRAAFEEDVVKPLREAALTVVHGTP
jgi:uncharacterized protein YfdQ (DUF2303 family)